MAAVSTTGRRADGQRQHPVRQLRRLRRWRHLQRNYGTLTVSGSTLSGNVAAYRGGGIANYGTVTVNNSSTITGNTAPVGFGADVYNQGVLYLDSSSTIGILDGNPAVRI